jgi:hypothetical protein
MGLRWRVTPCQDGCAARDLNPEPAGLRVRFILLYEVSGHTGDYRVVPVRARHGK